MIIDSSSGYDCTYIGKYCIYLTCTWAPTDVAAGVCKARGTKWFTKLSDNYFCRCVNHPASEDYPYALEFNSLDDVKADIAMREL